MSIRFEGGADRIYRLDMVEIGKGIRWNSMGFGHGIILDVRKDGNFPVPFQAMTGGLVFSMRKHFSPRFVKFRR
jgi:hypothetical protein